ncbi:MAG: uracil-DNA glycosylase family protein [Nitrososphaerota archaeon]
MVRCAPPENKPTRSEINNCIQYLAWELKLLKNIKVCIALGRLAFSTYIQLVRREGVLHNSVPRFSHGVVHKLEGMLYGRPLPVLISSYHPSRQNTNTGRLTQHLLDSAFLKAKTIVG